MKKCARCRKRKRLCDFPSNRAKKDGKGHYCLECQREYVRRHYVSNRRYYLEKSKKRNAAIRTRFGEAIRVAKDVPCADCGVRYQPWVMDFDHVRGKKKFNVASAAVHCRSLGELTAEILKCDVVCANCHRQRTHDRLAGSSPGGRATSSCSRAGPQVTSPAP